MSSKTAVDPRVDKRRVTMTNYVAVGDGQTEKTEAVDFVRPDFLDAYVADAQTKWQEVVVSDEPDAGPAGYDGETTIPSHLDHPAAGTFYPATEA